MIVKKYWYEWSGIEYTPWKGYFLFGFIPLHIEQITNA